MLSTDDDINRYIDLCMHLDAIDLSVADRQQVLINFIEIMRVADSVLTFPIPEDIELAATYRP